MKKKEKKLPEVTDHCEWAVAEQIKLVEGWLLQVATTLEAIRIRVEEEGVAAQPPPRQLIDRAQVASQTGVKEQAVGALIIYAGFPKAVQNFPVMWDAAEVDEWVKAKKAKPKSKAGKETEEHPQPEELSEEDRICERARVLFKGGGSRSVSNYRDKFAAMKDLTRIYIAAPRSWGPQPGQQETPRSRIVRKAGLSTTTLRTWIQLLDNGVTAEDMQAAGQKLIVALMRKGTLKVWLRERRN